MNWKMFEGKRVFIQLTSGAIYTGVVLDIDDSSKIIFITIRDKFDMIVTIVHSEIKIIKEQGE